MAGRAPREKVLYVVFGHPIIVPRAPVTSVPISYIYSPSQLLSLVRALGIQRVVFVSMPPIASSYYYALQREGVQVQYAASFAPPRGLIEGREYYTLVVEPAGSSLRIVGGSVPRHLLSTL